MNRREIVYDGEEIISDTYRDVSWEVLRRSRDADLAQSDAWVIGDRPHTEQVREAILEYRQLLRDLPSDFEGDNANEACDNYPSRPEGF